MRFSHFVCCRPTAEKAVLTTNCPIPPNFFIAPRGYIAGDFITDYQQFMQLLFVN
jgi:hypothetical protein